MGDKPQGKNAASTAVYEQLLDDYAPEACAWVLKYEWEGPQSVPLKAIDSSKRKDWAATREPVAIAFHTIKIAEGKRKPLILVRVEGEKLLNLADGHHRFLAYEILQEPVQAWVVTVPKSEHGWQPMHDEQGQGSQQQSSQRSNQQLPRHQLPKEPFESGDPVKTRDYIQSLRGGPVVLRAEFDAYAVAYYRRHPNEERILMTTAAPVPTKVAVLAIVRASEAHTHQSGDHGRVLVVARKEPPYEYALPSGMVDEGETPEQAVCRELREETGIDVTGLYPCYGRVGGDSSNRWEPIILDAPEGGVRVHVYCVYRWTGIPVDGEGPLDATGVAKPGVRWMTPPELLGQASKFKASVQKLLELHALDSQFNASGPQAAVDGAYDRRMLDLSPSDVHVPSATAAKTKKVKAKFPTAAHVKAAIAQLDDDLKQARVSKSTGAAMHKEYVAAGKAFGLDIASDKDGLPVGQSSAPPIAHPGPLRSRPRPANGQRGRLDVTIDHPQHGRLEIRHLSDRIAQGVALTDRDLELLDGRAEAMPSGSVCLYSKQELVAMVDEAGGLTWNQIATRGTFAGHGAGVFTLDDSVFNEIIRNYRDVDGGEVAFDFEHASEQDAASGTIPVSGCPATGWIRDMQIRPAGLFTLVDFLEPAKSYVKDKRYRFVSPAIRFGAKHPVTGKPIGARLTSTALTNQPFLRGLQPLAAKDTAPVQGAPSLTLDGKNRRMAAFALAHSPHEFMPKIAACLDMHPITTPMQCGERLKALREMCMSMDSNGMSNGVDCAAYCDKLRDLTNAPMGSTVDDVFETVQRMIDAAIAAHVQAMHPEGSVQNTTAIEHLTAPPAPANKVDAATAIEHLKDTPPARGANNEDTMADSTVTLKDVTTKLTAAEDKIAELTLTLKDRDAKLTTAEGEVVRLKDEATKREAAIVDERVEEAFESYKDAKKLILEDKEMMKTYCLSNRPGFDKLYPRLLGPKKYLMRSLTSDGKDVALTTDGGMEPPVRVITAQVDGKDVILGESPQVTTLRIREVHPSMSFSDAQEKAHKLHAGR